MNRLTLGWRGGYSLGSGMGVNQIEEYTAWIVGVGGMREGELFRLKIDH